MNRIDTLPPEIELAQLLQRCAARDPAAFRSLYDKTSPILFARLLRMLRRRSVAEEALQDVYVRIWDILSGRDTSPKYGRLSAADRRDVVDILRETLHDLPSEFR